MSIEKKEVESKEILDEDLYDEIEDEYGSNIEEEVNVADDEEKNIAKSTEDYFEIEFNKEKMKGLLSLDVMEERLSKKSASRDLVTMLIKLNTKDPKSLKNSIKDCVNCGDLSKYVAMKMKMLKTSPEYRSVLMKIEEEISDSHDKLFDYMFDIYRLGGRKKTKHYQAFYEEFKIAIRNASE